MKKIIFNCIAILVLFKIGNSQTAVDFNLMDCNNKPQHLYSILDKGYIAILVYEHQCGSCTQGAKNLKTVVSNFYSTDTLLKIMYLDNGGYSCASISNWIIANGLSTGLTFQYSSSFSSPYGNGMPVIVVAAGKNYKTYLIADGVAFADTNAIHVGINNAKKALSSGINNISSGQGFQINPNPVSDNLIVNISSDISGIIKFKILDITGKMILQNEIEKTQTHPNQIEIPVLGLKDGIYFLQLSTKEGNFFNKFEVQK